MNTTILVIDGFGVGAMPDANDRNADTLGTLLSRSARRERLFRIPNLAALGLAAIRPDLNLNSSAIKGIDAVARRSALGYPGADTFAGHQTMMGADMSHVVTCSLGERAKQVTEALDAAGFVVEALRSGRILLLDGEILVHDNLEADPGINWNVSGRLDHISWNRILEASTTVRSVAPVARVIAVGGYADGPLTDYVREGANGVVGMDTPATGFYRNDGLKVQHMGVEIDHTHQLPEAAARAGKRVALIGKASDILVTDHAVTRLPGVSTEQNLESIARTTGDHDLVVANIQETDLAGHQQDPDRYIEVVEQVDEFLGEHLTRFGTGDLLIVTGDHGNDPEIGHAFHTREYVPVLAARRGDGYIATAADLTSLADVGASVAKVLGLQPQSIGHGNPTHLI